MIRAVVELVRNVEKDGQGRQLYYMPFRSSFLLLTPFRPEVEAAGLAPEPAPQNSATFFRPGLACGPHHLSPIFVHNLSNADPWEVWLVHLGKD
jgi:hypothetical protein